MPTPLNLISEATEYRFCCHNGPDAVYQVTSSPDVSEKPAARVTRADTKWQLATQDKSSNVERIAITAVRTDINPWINDWVNQAWSFNSSQWYMVRNLSVFLSVVRWPTTQNYYYAPRMLF